MWSHCVFRAPLCQGLSFETWGGDGRWKSWRGFETIVRILAASAKWVSLFVFHKSTGRNSFNCYLSFPDLCGVFTLPSLVIASCGFRSQSPQLTTSECHSNWGGGTDWPIRIRRLPSQYPPHSGSPQLVGTLKQKYPWDLLRVYTFQK
jgi:hypothetical protein